MNTRFRLAAAALGFLVALALVELGLRASGMGFGNSPMEPDPVLHHVHPKNYSFVQQHPSGELGGFEIEYNAEGRVHRGGAAPATASGPPPACRVALLGDSFTEAGQVPFAASFAGLLEDAAGETCEVRNYGTRSYSPAIYLVQWTEVVRDWQPTHVFVLLFGGDVGEDARYMARASVDGQGFPVAIEGPSDAWLVSQLRQFYVARFARAAYMRLSWAVEHWGEDTMQIGGVVEENPTFEPLSQGLVAELDRRVRETGAELILMVVPSRYRLMGDGTIRMDRDFNQKVQAWADGQGVRFLDLYPAFERASHAGFTLFFRQDIHFTADGHAVAAATIARAFPQLFDASRIAAPPAAAAFGRATP